MPLINKRVYKKLPVLCQSSDMQAKNNKRLRLKRKMIKTTDGMNAIVFMTDRISRCHYYQHIKDRRNEFTLSLPRELFVILNFD